MHILITNLSLSLYAFYKASILLLYYTILFIQEPFTIFSILYDYVICNCDICDHTVTDITSLLWYLTIVTIIYDIILNL